MKKLLWILVTIGLILSFTACSDSKPYKEQGETQSSSETQTSDEVSSSNETQASDEVSSLAENENEDFGLNETAVFDDLKFTATEIKESEGTEFFTPKSGNVFVGIKFTIENISDENQTVSTLMLFNAYADDVKCDYSISASCVFDEGTLDGDLAPGKKLVGWYALEVPKDWSSIELEVQQSWLSNNSAKFVFTK